MKRLLSLLLCLSLTGCTDMLIQVSPTHIRTYAVTSPLPTNDVPKEVTLQKQIDIDFMVMIEGAFDVINWGVSTLFDLGSKVLGGLIVEGPGGGNTSG